MRKSDSIAIVGAGAAGLSAAHELRKRGYERVTVYDRRARVGGKCLTETIRGRRHEIGALIVGIQYDNIMEMLQEVGLETAPLDPIRIVDTDDMGTQVWPFRGWSLRKRFQFLRMAALCLRRHRKLGRPGFSESDRFEDAARTFDECLRRERLAFAKEAVAPYYVGWGYGYLENVSAVYVFKLFEFYLQSLKKILLARYRMRFNRHIPEGYQRLWEKVAAPLELCLGTRIVSIRRGPRVTMETGEGTRFFDKLILACPLQGASAFLDTDWEERHLFSKIRTLDFVTLACEADGLPPHNLIFVKNNLSPLKPGRIVSWYRRFKDQDVYVFYMIANRETPDERLLSNAREDLGKMGARLGRIYRLDHWDYFPHVDPADIAQGYFRRLEALQGKHSTWYTGELLSFPTTEHVVAYSRRLVQKYF